MSKNAENIYTLENTKADCIYRDATGMWQFRRTLPQTEFSTYEEAHTAIKEIEEQGLYATDIKIVKW